MKSKKVLLVEDNYLNRRLFKNNLSENGYEVLEAKNVDEALQILRKEAIDIAVLDIHLGDGEEDGISLGHQIKDKYKIPFIYLTAYDNSEIISKAVKTEAYSYLTKPFKVIDLIASIEIAIKQASNILKTKPTIQVKDGDYLVKLDLDQIDFIESDGNYLLIYTQDKVYKMRSTIKQILENLPNSNFTQVHRAYIVNKDKIEKFNQKFIVINQTEIPISRSLDELNLY